jgi:hypothetical protein
VSVLELPKGLVLDEGRRAVFVWGSVHLFKDAWREIYKELSRFLEHGIIKVSAIALETQCWTLKFGFYEADEGEKVEWGVGGWTGEN